MNYHHRSRPSSKRFLPVPEETVCPEALEIEARQRKLHEAGKETTRYRDPLEPASEVCPDLLVLMVAREARAWGPKSHNRLSRELADVLSTTFEEAQTLLKNGVKDLEEREKR